MNCDDKQDKVFHKGEWLTAKEFIIRFVKLIVRDNTEMDASPDKAFYDSVRVAAGGERIKDVAFDESNDFVILARDVVDLLHSIRRDQIIPEHERMRFDEPAVYVVNKEDASASSEVYIKSKIFNEGKALNEVEFLKGFVELLELNLGSSGSIGNPEISYTVQVSNSPKKPANKMTLVMEEPASSATRNHAVRDYLRSKIFNNQRPLTCELDCVVDIGKVIVADLEPELKNQVFSAELINNVNKERPWTGGVVLKDTDFSEKLDEFYDLEILTKEEIEIAQSKQYDFRLNEKEIKKLKM